MTETNVQWLKLKCTMTETNVQWLKLMTMTETNDNDWN
jgi:hypothetical protein